MLNLLHTLVALSTLLSTTGVSVSAHYCAGELVDWELFGAARACGMGAEVERVPEDGESLRKVDCCRDAHVFAQLDVQDTSAPAFAAPAPVADLPPSPVRFGFAKPAPSAAFGPALPVVRPPPLRPRGQRRALLQRYTL